MSVVVPAYNEARNLPTLLVQLGDALRGLTDDWEVIVVDDGSRDATARLVRDYPAGAFRVELLERRKNGGYGAAMKDGLALARQSKPDVVACIHADGQYAPEVLPELIEQLSQRRLALLQGSRIAGGTALRGGMPIYKYVGNALLNLIENQTLGLSLTDYHSGYLVYGAAALDLPFSTLSNSFDFDLEVIATARAHGLPVGEAPIPTHYGDEVSHLNPLTYGLRVLRVMWNYQRGRYAP
jgi:glycosyltransferase involved in cell wall biosynthesis